MITYNEKEKHNIKTQKAYLNLLRNKNNRLHFTLSFKEGTKDKITEKGINHVIKYLNHHLFGRNFKKKGQFIAGFCIREHSKNGTYHYHCILQLSTQGLKPNHLPLIKPLLTNVIKKLTDLKQSNPKPISSNHGWRLQKYYPDKLEQYLLKQVKQYDQTFLITCNIGILSKHKILFGEPLSTLI